MELKEVIGQAALKQQLVAMVQQNRLGHALLLIGKEGSGALPLAIAFAQWMVCQPGKHTSPPAPALFGEETSANNKIDFISPETISQMPNFARALQFMHPDLHFSYPVIPKKSGDKPVSTDYFKEWKEFIQQYPYGNVYDWLQFIGAENKQGNITAEECNDIMRKLNLKSFESAYKILILWMPEYLGKEGNKLLKLIEEPPPNTLFILVAEQEEGVLPTLVSRCQVIRVPMIEKQDIETALIERAHLPAHTAAQIAGVCGGNYREALQMIQDTSSDWQSLLREWLNATLKAGPAAQLKFIDEMAKAGREKQKQFLRYFIHLLEQSLHIRLLGIESANCLPAESDFAQRLNKIASVTQQQAIVEELDNAIYYIERNANAKMLFMALTIKLQYIIQNKVTLHV
ncbi:MAG: DNA polymerase III subunit delta' [Hydrotalea sp. AMD]|uniref:DNA polymerase III subunit n=1 Tax=Hydrotalea sp. AMD TaxID=2501297 RepID=UPI0009431197|nr:DNA polymerase III subunit delta' [Hydrotalea sp. AMD]RTL55488.1 MAG: DNA polymerase III subunit delta' [Sphingobacteriales bacterium]RWZ88134.1 MAG: DNA polymerase III subunit delta' [Hydrotalea sp. AMD]